MIKLDIKTVLNILQEHNVYGHVTNVSVGPIITRYEFEPTLNNNETAAHQLKQIQDIFCTFPGVMCTVLGTNLIGIDIVNPERQKIHLSDLKYNLLDNIIPICLGTDIFGRTVNKDLCQLKNILVTGRPNTGKTSLIQSMLMPSVLKFTHNQCRLLIIDPKGIDFDESDNIPHLIQPIIRFDCVTTVSALENILQEQNNRYRQLQDFRVDNISNRHNPYIIVVINDADCFLPTHSNIAIFKRFESVIKQLVNNGHNVGIYVMVGMQYSLYQNFGSMFAAKAIFNFSAPESKELIGSTNAEKLLNCGDMLFIEANKPPIRIHTGI